MAIFAVFLRGSTNTHNAVDNCIWVGEADNGDEAKKLAQEEEGVNVYNGQFLEAAEPFDFSLEDQELIGYWQPAPKPY